MAEIATDEIGPSFRARKKNFAPHFAKTKSAARDIIEATLSTALGDELRHSRIKQFPSGAAGPRWNNG
ncbi:hypothetical protein [Aquicoccus sp. SU-CL01552]|uniref:hypothetical protein n=1 Tax=Aquicoccus sp. SU-CL01552 TaxID=3127656 RepID=UPI00333EFEB5